MTVDWIVLTAAAVAVAIAAASVLGKPGTADGMFGWLYYTEFMLGEYVPNKMGYTCSYFVAYFDSSC